MSEKSKSPTPPNAAGLEAEIDRLQRRLDELRGAQTFGRIIVLVLVLIIIGEFALFVFQTRSRIAENFEQQQVKKAISDTVPQVMPQLRDHIMKVAEDVLPVYRDAALARFQQAGPEVAHDAMQRLQKLPDEEGQMLRERLAQTMNAAVLQLQPDIRKTAPTLSDDKKTQIIEEEFNTAVKKQDEAIAKHMVKVYDDQRHTLLDVLQKFDIPSDSTYREQMARQREFLHALVDVMMDGDLRFSLPATPAAAATMPTASAAGTAAQRAPISAATH